ncbi:hypothetical protein [Tahibacter amnicola]|uniref:Uncharacterized protein n=1 Tax=Tahibacter amnicola TaxID=2976241 RepID=A0ABY6BIK7_9GAMM|nr:hypothetical protein [Tahibacter amnicola]UXI69848.1 hypothetical protein N4264_09540 [Tahibacter amnicola]
MSYQKIEWTQAPAWANYWQVSPTGTQAYWLRDKPVQDVILDGGSFASMEGVSEADLFGYKGTWQDSLTARPTLSLRST